MTSVTIHDVAHFAPSASADDVRDALRCVACASPSDLVRVAAVDGARHAVIACGYGQTTRLGLTDAQAYRLWTLPRGRMFVHVAPDAL